MSHVMPAESEPKERGHGFIRRTWAMLIKEFVQLRRDRVSLGMIAVMPLMQLMLFGYAINTTPRNLPTAVLLQENSDLGRSILAAMENTGVETRAAGDWRGLKWSKLCINLLANGVCAALDWTPAQVYADKTAFDVERACLIEAVAVMRRLGIAPVGLVGFPVPVLVAAIRSLSATLLRAVLSRRVVTARGDKLPSLLLDLRARKKLTEVDDLNGAVVARAGEAGVVTPANAAIARIVDGIASGTIDWGVFRGKPQALAAASIS